MSCFGVNTRACGLTLGVAAALTGCGISATHDASTTAKATAQAASNTTTPTKAQPLAVVVTNSTRQADSYTVAIISDGSGKTVASATAHLPSVKLGSDLDLPLVSVSSTRAYFLDGDTKVRSLAPDGTTADVTTIPEGATDNVTFAVSLDDKRIAIGGINPNPLSGATWVEDLHVATNRVHLFDFQGADAFRWPVGWVDGNLIVALRATLGCGGYGANIASNVNNGGGGGGGGGVGGGGVGGGGVGGVGGGGVGGGGVGAGGVGFSTAILGEYNCPGAYHIVNATNGAHLANVCQSADRINSGADDLIPVGPLTRNGVACLDYNNGYGIAHWDGTHTVFSVQPVLRTFACGISLDATQLACSGNTGVYSSPAVLVKADHSVVSLGHHYSILGWMDNDCMLVSFDRDHLGIVAAQQNGMHISIPFANADQVTMVGTLPA